MGFRVKVVKNKVAPPFRYVSLILYGEGFQNWRNTDIGTNAGIIDKRIPLVW